MWDEDINATIASVWEFLSTQATSVNSLTIHRQTGIPMSRIVSVLSQLAEINLLSVAERKEDQWALKKSITALDWARAVEAGVPLICLEQTMSLSSQERKKAEKALTSGQIDEERTKRQKTKLKKRQDVIRGRAASRAAATDLAKIVEDAHLALSQRSSPVNDVFREEASKALEALITAIERNRMTTSSHPEE